MKACAGNYQHHCSQPWMVMDSGLRDLLDIALACGISHMTTTRRSSKDWKKPSSLCPAMRLKIADNLFFSKCTMLGAELERFNPHFVNRVAHC